jgi:hypothetical protein
VDDHRDVLPDPADDPVECLQLTADDQVQDRIYRVNCDSSSGRTGWTNALLRRLCDDRTGTAAGIADTPPLTIHLSLTSFFNKILRRAISGEGRDLLVGARLIMIPKGANAYRPIRIECAMMRLLGAAACDQACLQVAPFLRPHQVGGGLKGGVEFGARLLNIGHNQGDTIISIDVENAFNSTRHINVFQEILDKAPKLARIFRWKYGTPSSMRDECRCHRRAHLYRCRSR